MLSFFPTPYPDELLYSTLARYHIRSGNKSFKQTDLDLFGYTSQQLCKITLTNNLNYLVKNLPLRSQETVDNLLYNHTLYSFYATFLIPQEVWLLKDSMSKKLTVSILEIAKEATHSTSVLKKILKFCPVCVEQDTQQFGEAYWHRIHQIPGVFVCLTHGVSLQNSTVPMETESVSYHAASSENCVVNTTAITYTDETLNKFFIIAQDIQQLINMKISFKGLAWLRSQYQYYLAKNNFLTTYSRTKYKFYEDNFYNSMLAFYGQECLAVVLPHLGNSPAKYFTNCLLACDLNPMIDRVAHILLIKFLANSIEDFFNKPLL